MSTTATSQPLQRAPLYLQTYDILTRSLQGGEWQPGELIPGEQALARRFQVSAGTVRKAIDRLVAEHILMRRQGKGTFVASHTEPRNEFRFLRLRNDGNDVPEFTSRVLGCRRLRASQEIAGRLELAPGDSLIHIRRVLDFEGQPNVLDDIWLPAARFQGLNAEQLTSYKGPLYALFEAEYGTRMISATERVSAVLASSNAAGMLAVDKATPLLRVERVTETYDGEKVELRRGLYLTTNYHYLSNLG